MPAQTVGEADEIQAGMRRRLARGGARFSSLVECTGGFDERLETAAEPGRGDDCIEWIARSVGKDRLGRGEPLERCPHVDASPLERLDEADVDDRHTARGV